jgi:hypothetical protein
MTDVPFPTAEQPHPEEAHPPAPTRNRKPIMVAAGGAVAALTIAIGAFVMHGGSSTAKTNATATSSASANPGRPGARPGTSGAIASKSGSTLAVTNAAGQRVTVVTKPSTVVTRTMPGSSAEIKVGDHVIARGTTTGTAVAATGVTDLGTNPPVQGAFPGRNGGGNGAAPNGGTPSGAPNANAATRGSQGTVTAVNPSGFTMTDANGTSMTVSTNGSTTFNVTTNSTVDSLVVGEQIQVNGSTGSDGTVTATAIRVGVGGGFGGGNPNRPSTGA